MLKNLFDLSYKRTVLQAIGWFVVYGILLLAITLLVLVIISEVLLKTLIIPNKKRPEGANSNYGPRNGVVLLGGIKRQLDTNDADKKVYHQCLYYFSSPRGIKFCNQ